MALKIPPALLVLISVGLMWLVNFAAPSLALDFPFQRLLSNAFGLAGIGIIAVAVASFFRSGTTVDPTAPAKADALVVSGLYRFTRNPMYLGMALILCAIAVRMGNPLAFAVVAGFVGYMTLFQIKPEERALREKFGEEYDEYCRRVRRWI